MKKPWGISQLSNAFVYIREWGGKKMRYLMWFFIYIHSLCAFDFDIKRIEDHLELKFALANVAIFPCPYVVIEGILPDDLYHELETHWPTEVFNGPVNIENMLTDEYTKHLWQQFSELVSNKLLKKKIADLFRPFTRYKFGRYIEDSIACNSKSLSEHRLVQNFFIRPHIDQGYIYMPVFIYMPLTDNNPEFGTYLFRHLHEKKALDVEYADSVEVEAVVVAPYKKNTLFAFMRTPESWHGSVQCSDIPRRFYMSNIYLSEHFMKSFYHNTFDIESNGVLLDENNPY